MLGLCGRRYKLPKEHGLGHVFGKFEASKRRLSIQVRNPLPWFLLSCRAWLTKRACGWQEYGVSETTLEQIFNQFAAQQEEETGPVRGLLS